ncbi:MAG: hypothetical protein N3E40_06735, partial [Dehalococcoidia bacterium]|nr:hypothetical protein [Dehalococcoidia bacterium]
MTHWMCTKCGYLITAETPPDRCPSCHVPCQFNNVTCYYPECGGEENIDPILVGATLRAIGRSEKAPVSGSGPKVGKVAKVQIFSG